MYDPIIGRFISPDSIVPDQYNPQSLNRYSYCLNNPLIYTDPTGHQEDLHKLPEYTPNTQRNYTPSYGGFGFGGFSSSGGGTDSYGGTNWMGIGLYYQWLVQQAEAEAREKYTICPSTDPLEQKTYLTLTMSAGVNYALLNLEGGSVFAIDMSTGVVYAYNYIAGGGGGGVPVLGGGATVQIGAINMDSPLDLTGLGLEASAFAAAIKGWSAQASWTRPFGIFPDGVASGPAFGYGAGISGMVTYTWYRGEYDLNNLPSDILKILEPYLPQLSDGCD